MGREGREKGREKSSDAPCRFRAVNAELDRVSRERRHLPRFKVLKLRLAGGFESYLRSHSFNGLTLTALCLRSV